MALLETTLGIPIGYVGARWIGSAAGTALRPIAKGLIKSVLIVGDGIGEIFDGSAVRSEPRPRRRGVTIAVAAAATTAKRTAPGTRRKGTSARGKQARPRKAVHH